MVKKEDIIKIDEKLIQIGDDINYIHGRSDLIESKLDSKVDQEKFYTLEQKVAEFKTLIKK